MVKMPMRAPVLFGILSCIFLCLTLVDSFSTSFDVARPFLRAFTPKKQKSVVLFAASPLDSSLQQQPSLRVARQVQPSVALVTPRGVRNMTARGSGFVLDYWDNVSEDEESFLYMITAAHVATPGQRMEVTLFGEETARPATVLGRNVTLDLALLQVPFQKPSGEQQLNVRPAGLKIASTVPEVGSMAFAHGFPASRMRGPAMTCGIVCGIADGLGVPDDMQMTGRQKRDSKPESDTATAQHQTCFVVTDAAMSGGMSGGPLVDAEGTVLGVNALIRPDLRALGNYAVSAEEIRAFLDRMEMADIIPDGEDSLLKMNRSDKATRYRVIIFNDPMNKKERVARVLKQVAKLEDQAANQVMMEAHTTGQGMVREFSGRSEADDLCNSIRNEDILVEVESAP